MSEAVEKVAVEVDRREAPVRSAAERGMAAARVVACAFGALWLLYTVLFVRSLLPYWFDPAYTTDDALQQIFPFHEALRPGVFKGDIIYTMMMCYLAPIHYWLSFVITKLTGDAIMMSHWVMLLQLASSALFMFLAVRRLSSTAPAFFAVVWMLHSRLALQRLSGGLPRGWGLPVFVAYLYFAAAGSHRGILLLLALGTLLHPGATFLVGVAYGFWLLSGVANPKTRAQFARPFIEACVAAPCIGALLLFVTQMPPEIGTMADYARASQMPEFQRPGGRFPFLPLLPIWKELYEFGFQPFITKFYNPELGLHVGALAHLGLDPQVGLGVILGAFAVTLGVLAVAQRLGRVRISRELWAILAISAVAYLSAWAFGLSDGPTPPAVRPMTPFVVIWALTMLVVLGRRLGVRAVPSELWTFLLGAFTVYIASRLLVFKLYVPNRHVQLPFTTFWIVAFTVAAWRIWSARKERVGTSERVVSTPMRGAAALVALGLFFSFTGGSGLYGPFNFNYSSEKKGKAFTWMARQTPLDSLVAGEPTLIDPVQLFGERRGYITSETAHPFYDGYYAEVKRRLEVTLRAHYARDLGELVRILDAEGIDYFVFDRFKFTGEALRNSQYYPPFDTLVQELTSYPPEEYAFRKLPHDDKAVPFRDNRAIVVSVRGLQHYLSEHPL